MPRRRTLVLGLVLVLAATALPAAGRQAQPPQANPCRDPRLALRCPDLVMAPPSDLRVQRVGSSLRLLAQNRIVNVGQGPLELRGDRGTNPLLVSATQVIRRTDGRPPLFLPHAGFFFWKAIPGQGHYWKYWQAARWELRVERPDGTAGALRRTGPKLSYCFRDLKRSRSWRRTPRAAIFPACSERYDQARLRIGVSPGWADIYPSGYHENWISITGLSGCFVFQHRADPRNDIAESSEADNVGSLVVQLPPRQGSVTPRSCPPER